MNLPQRKKSAEEIAKLREELGVFAQAPAPQALLPQAPEIVAAPPAPPEVIEEPPAFTPTAPVVAASLPTLEHPPKSGMSPLPDQIPRRGPKPVSSLRKSERIPILPTVALVEDHTPQGIVVKSLRKSEQLPVTILKQETPAFSHLPTHKRSESDLNTIRQKDALAARLTPPPPKLTAPTPLIIFGYVAALLGPLLTYLDSEIFYPSGFTALALLTAAWIFLKKSQSRAHAAFIFIIVFFSILYVVFHYFPQLRHVS